MEEQQTILVYRYSFWDDHYQIRQVSTGWATLDAIRNGLGVPIFTESKRVPSTEVIGGVWIEKSPPTIPSRN